jgi:predicted methyltransferase
MLLRDGRIVPVLILLVPLWVVPAAHAAGGSASAAGAAIAAAIADPARPAADRERDPERKPREMLELAHVKPGERIAELMPGGGYFTRLFSKAVGPSGHVYALVPAPAPDAPADAPDFAARAKAIAADPAYANVTVLVLPFNELKLPQPVDLVWTSQNYHDLHNRKDLDPVTIDRALYAALKPGGSYIVLDHAAAAGSGTEATSTLHRIDPAAVKREVLAAGFKFVNSSDLLRDVNDDHSLKVFDPAIRGRTDQFILVFRKP